MELINEIKLYHPIKQLIWVIQDSTVSSETGNGSSNVDALANVSGQTQNNKNDYFNYRANSQGNEEIIYATPSYYLLEQQNYD